MSDHPTNQSAGVPQERTTPVAEDDSGVIQIPNDQVPPALRNAPHPDQIRTYDVTVNGRTEQWDLSKLISEAQQGAAGREKFQEASQLRKDAAKAMALQEDMELVFKEGDLDAFRRLGAAFGVPGDEVEQIAAKTFSGEDDDEDDDPVGSYDQQVSQNANRSAAQQKAGPVDYAAMSPDVQRVLRGAEKTRIDGIVKNALDNDESICSNKTAHSPEGQKAIRRYVDEKIRGRLDSFGGDFGDGTRILAEVLPEIREHLQALGTPGKRTNTGLGQSPGGGDTEVYPRQMPDHVPSTEGDAFEQNVLETMAYHQAQAERGSQQ